MCFRHKFLCIGECIFGVLMVIGFAVGLYISITTGMVIGGSSGWFAGFVQLILSWSGTLILALLIYSLLDIAHTLRKECSDEKKGGYCAKADE